MHLMVAQPAGLAANSILVVLILIVALPAGLAANAILVVLIN